MSENRTVHAEGCGHAVVRYDRAGKWYVESLDDLRVSVTLDEAARSAIRIATRPGGMLYLGRPGGTAFDRKVRALRAEC